MLLVRLNTLSTFCSATKSLKRYKFEMKGIVFDPLEIVARCQISIVVRVIRNEYLMEGVVKLEKLGIGIYSSAGAVFYTIFRSIKNIVKYKKGGFIMCGNDTCGSGMESSEGCGTQEGKCGCCHETSKEEMMFNMMLEIADSAWMKLMKEKMMKHYEKTKGHEMEKMAQMMADANSTRWMNEEEFMKMKPGMLEMMKKKMEEDKAKK